MIISETYACGICDKPLLSEERERIVALRCMQPPEHVFHGSCLDDWRSTEGTDIGKTCPTCMVNPVQALTRRLTTTVIKQRIQKRRESCWRHFWAEWARQRSIMVLVMMAVMMAFVIIQVLQEWIRTWSNQHRTDL